MRSGIRKVIVLLMSGIMLAGCSAGSGQVTGNQESTVAESTASEINAPEADVPENAAPKIKYVFYFIGDGMGSSHRQLAEYYNQWKYGNRNQLVMNDMPVSTSLTTYSLNSFITDSAASGTALSTGHKTTSNSVGVNEEGTVEYRSISEALKEKGMSIGLLTTVGIANATPATFGAHVANRGEEALVAEQYLAREWDYLAGGGKRFFMSAEEGGKREQSLLPAFSEKGYTIDTSLEEYLDTDFSEVEKYLGIYEDNKLTDAITQLNTKRTSPELYQMVENGIKVLSKNEKGFFMMVEGGYVDTASHNNDTATVLYEVLALDRAVKSAVNFYHQHPEETLILVTADHETGGLSLGSNTYMINFEALDQIEASFGAAIEPYAMVNDMEGMYRAIEENWHVPVSEEDKQAIQDCIDNFDLNTLVEGLGRNYTPEQMAQYEETRHMLGIAGYACAPLLTRETKIGWATQGHTAERVPLTAMGAGCEGFAGCRDNSDVPKVLAELMEVELD